MRRPQEQRDVQTARAAIADERRATVAFLREGGLNSIAERVERGDHIRQVLNQESSHAG